MADYTRWTKEALVRRIQQLEKTLETSLTQEVARLPKPQPADIVPSVAATGRENGAAKQQPPPPAKASPNGLPQQGEQPPKKKQKNSFDMSRYATRPIALKIAYLGKRYTGFEFQPHGTEPSIEEELWKALVKACLISPAPGSPPDAVDFSVCDYSKCGRTDKGVSSFGQVVALRVRSNLKLKKTSSNEDGSDGAAETSPEDAANLVYPPPEQEITYCKTLNRILPQDIRVLAWCPEPFPGFSARFSCRERRYRYFFTQPAFFGPADPNVSADYDRNWLDIDAMREAARHFTGLHDFRNFCRIDPKKQITNFMRRIFESDIVEVEDMGSSLSCFKDSVPGGGPTPKVYSFDVRGSAFLWHQIRHMVAILFLVGQGREDPSIVPALLDVKAHPRRPNYGMADETPLVLWDCIFPDLNELQEDEESPNMPALRTHVDTLNWRYVGEEAPLSRKFTDGIWQQWHGVKMDEILANRMLDIMTGGRPVAPDPVTGQPRCTTGMVTSPLPQPDKSIHYDGGDEPRTAGVYVPLLKRGRLASAEEINDKYAKQMGFADSETMRGHGNWRAVIKARKDDDKVKTKAAIEVPDQVVQVQAQAQG